VAYPSISAAAALALPEPAARVVRGRRRFGYVEIADEPGELPAHAPARRTRQAPGDRPRQPGQRAAAAPAASAAARRGRAAKTAKKIPARKAPGRKSGGTRRDR
jgi:hypothetical protein